MFKLLIVFGHLLAVCLAIGTVLLTDLRLLARTVGSPVVIAPPSRFESRVVAWSLGVMAVTGAALIGLDLGSSPGPLANPKLQGKLMLVALLVLNGWVLHRYVFPRLEQGTAVSAWTGGQCWFVALTVGLSNSLWLFIAFLGIARPWNHAIDLVSVLWIGLGLWALAAGVIRTVLMVAAREPLFEQTVAASEQLFEQTVMLEPPLTGDPLRRGGGSAWNMQPAQQRRTRY